MARRIVRYAAAAALVLVVLAALSTPATAQQAPAVGGDHANFNQILFRVVQVLVFSALGLLILLIGFRALDMATPFSLNKEIAEDDNTSAGVVVAGMMIALGMIIHGALTSSFDLMF